MWYGPAQPITINIQGGDVTLVLTDFSGKPFEAKGEDDVADGQSADLRAVFQQVNTPGTYLLFAVPKGQEFPRFIGTPLVITVRVDPRRDAPPEPMVLRIVPLQYATISTELGEATLIFWYDVAPNTIENFSRLAMQGFYDGLAFDRVVPDFLVQGGDPKGDGTGGPGYSINPEFSARPLVEGVIAMSRSNDPLEEQGAMPRYEAANSAGSQFFICLNYVNTKRFEGRYTAFGIVTAGMETVKKIAAVPLAKPEIPEKPVVIQKIEIKPVMPEANPYGDLLGMRAK
jgi:peptidyl-prolyl cis-trans isomerase B (cyclophilin B)